MGREDARDDGLEFLEHLRGDGVFVDAFILRDGAFERAALIHGSGSDYAARVGNCLHAFLLARGDLHVTPSARIRIVRGILACGEKRNHR